MADNDAFKVKVLPRDTIVDIDDFGKELQKICDKVAAGKVQLQFDDTALLTSIRTTLSQNTFNLQIDEAALVQSMEHALQNRIFRMNIDPIINGNGGGGGGGGGGGNRRRNRNPLGTGDTFSKLVSSEVYLRGLVKKREALPYNSPQRAGYETRINTYTTSLNARKSQYAAANNVSVAALDAAIQQTDQYTRALAASDEAAQKTRDAHEQAKSSVNDMATAMANAEARINELNGRKGQLEYVQLMNNLVTGTEPWENEEARRTDAAGNIIYREITQEDVGLLGDYVKRWKELQAYWNRQVGANGSRNLFDAKRPEEQATIIEELTTRFRALQEAEAAVNAEEADFEGHTGRYGNNFFDELASGIGEKIGWGVMAAGAAKARQAIRQVYTNVVELDGALTQISIVTGTSGNALSEFADTASSVAQKVGSTTAAVVSSTETYARLGYNLQDSLQLADITAQYANVAATDVSSATASLTSIMKSFNVAPEDMEGVVDMLVKVGQEYAISAGELGEAMQRGGAAMAAGGSSLEETIALFTAGNAAVQDASVVGREYCPAA